MEENTDSKRKTAPSIPANYISIHQLQERWNTEKNRKHKEEEDEEENTDGKRKTAPSIPDNYVSILQLQERWKQKEEKDGEERRRERQVEEQRKIEEDLKKSEVKEAGGKLIEGKHWKKKGKEKRSVDDGEARCAEKEELADIGSVGGEDAAPRNDRKHVRRHKKKKESVNGGEARYAEKEEPAAIESVGGEDAVPRDEGLPEKKRGYRKRYTNKKKKKNHDDVAVEEDVVVCESIVPPLEEDIVVCAIAPPLEEDVVCASIVTEITPPVKDEIRVNKKKGKKAKGKKSVEYREKAVTDSITAIETQFENLTIKSGETKNLKVQTRSSNRNPPYQSYDLPPRRVYGTMVWVKKGQSERGGDGIGNGVKPSNP